MKSSRSKMIGWCKQQDQFVSRMVQKIGKKWKQISKQLFLAYGIKKIGRQCRQRWYNHLNPEVSRKQWQVTQEDIIFEEYQKVGTKWTKIAEKLQGRSQNAVKNHFYAIIRRILRRMSKLVGTKNGTALIRKIKPSVISQIFLVEQQTKFYGTSNDQHSKLRVIIQKFLKNSRKKIFDVNRQKISAQDIESYQQILKQLKKFKQSFDSHSEQYQKSKIKQVTEGRKKLKFGPGQLDQYSYSICPSQQQFKPSKNIQRQMKLKKIQEKERPQLQSQQQELQQESDEIDQNVMKNDDNQQIKQPQDQNILIKHQNVTIKKQQIQQCIKQNAQPSVQDSGSKPTINEIKIQNYNNLVKVQGPMQGEPQILLQRQSRHYQSEVMSNIKKEYERQIQTKMDKRFQYMRQEKVDSKWGMEEMLMHLKQQIKRQIKLEMNSFIDNILSRGNVVVLPGSNIYFNYPASMPGHYINDPTKAQTAGFGNFNIDGHHSNLNLDFYQNFSNTKHNDFQNNQKSN